MQCEGLGVLMESVQEEEGEREGGRMKSSFFRAERQRFTSQR